MVIALARWKVVRAELVGVANQRDADARRGDSSTVVPKPAVTATPAAANGRAALAAVVGVGAARGQPPDERRRARAGDEPATSRSAADRRRRLAASSVNDAVPPGSDRSARQTCVAPRKSAGDHGPSRSSAAIPYSATPGMTAGAGPKIVCRRGKRRSVVARAGVPARAAPTVDGRLWTLDGASRLLGRRRPPAVVAASGGARRRQYRFAGAGRGLALQRRIERHGDDERDRVGRLGARSRDEPARRRLGAGGGRTSSATTFPGRVDVSTTWPRSPRRRRTGCAANGPPPAPRARLARCSPAAPRTSRRAFVACGRGPGRADRALEEERNQQGPARGHRADGSIGGVARSARVGRIASFAAGARRRGRLRRQGDPSRQWAGRRRLRPRAGERQRGPLDRRFVDPRSRQPAHAGQGPRARGRRHRSERRLRHRRRGRLHHAA